MKQQAQRHKATEAQREEARGESWLLGLVAVLLMLGGCVGVDPFGWDDHGLVVVGESGGARVVGSPEALFAEALGNYEEIKDYQCRMMRRERWLGMLGAVQEVDVKFRKEPFSVFFHWRKNPGKADKVLYVAGENEGKLMALPILIGWLTGPMALDPEGPEARQSSRRPITQFGFGNMLRRISRVYETGELSGGGQFSDSYADGVEVGGRRAVVIERRRVGEPPTDSAVGVKWRFCLDEENLMPIAVTAYNKDDNILVEYVFTDIRYNTGLTGEDFTLEAVGMAKKK